MITDNTGTRWVDTPPRKRRKPARALRFGEIKVGDQLMRVYTTKGWRGGKDDMNGPAIELSKDTWYYIVTDLWFDPVAGQRDPEAGNMVGIQHLDRVTAKPIGRKEARSRRGLASNGFTYADRDFVAFCAQRNEAMQTGNIVGIGRGRTLKKRPKLPSHRF